MRLRSRVLSIAFILLFPCSAQALPANFSASAVARKLPGTNIIEFRSFTDLRYNCDSHEIFVSSGEPFLGNLWMEPVRVPSSWMKIVDLYKYFPEDVERDKVVAHLQEIHMYAIISCQSEVWGRDIEVIMNKPSPYLELKFPSTKGQVLSGAPDSWVDHYND